MKFATGSDEKHAEMRTYLMQAIEYLGNGAMVEAFLTYLQYVCCMQFEQAHSLS